MGHRVILIGCFSVLVGAIGLNAFLALRGNPPGTLAQPLASLLPRQVANWTVHDLPVADTEEMKQAVGELLNYDDGIVRVFHKADMYVSVYVAYWRPGKMSPRLIAGHTPDGCWVKAGWKLLAAMERALPTGDGQVLLPARYQMFERQGERQYVVFWHFVDHRLVDYPETGSAPWWAMFRDLRRWGLHQRSEQVFLRISSNVPLEQFWTTEPVQRVVSALGPLTFFGPR